MAGLDVSSLTERIRCARFRGPLGADPVGTAGHYDAFVVVESPLPWARDATLCRPFVDLGWSGPCHVTGDGRRWRPVVVAAPSPAGARDPERRTVTVWERPAGPAAPYRARRWESTDPEACVELVRSIVQGDPQADASAPSELGASVAPAVHLCTHGRRDVCCGSLGTSLVELLEDARDHSLGDAVGQLGPIGSGAPVELWRCSHTGGHRFAPTGITFPDGLVWAHLDAGLVAELAAHAVDPASGPPSPDLVAACRGVSSLPEGPAQVADRAAWAEFGWDWVASERRVEVIGPVPADVEDSPVTVRVEGPLGSGTVQVAVARMVPMPTCGTVGPLPMVGESAETTDESVPSEPEWVVLGAEWERRERAPAPGVQ